MATTDYQQQMDASASYAAYAAAYPQQDAYAAYYQQYGTYPYAGYYGYGSAGYDPQAAQQQQPQSVGALGQPAAAAPTAAAAPGTEPAASGADTATASAAAAAMAAAPGAAAASWPAAGQQQAAYDPSAYQQYYASYGYYGGYPGGYPAPYPSAGYGQPQGQGQQQPPQQQQQPAPSPQQQHQPQHPRGPPGPRPPPGEPPSASKPGVGSGANAVPVRPRELPGSTGPRPGAGSGPYNNNNTSSYNSMPPPSALSGAGTTAPRQQQPITIRPQYPAARRPQPPGLSPLPSAPAQQPSPAQRPAAANPSYVKAQGGGGQAPPKPAAGGGGSQSGFPAAFTAWVERCFGRCRTDTERHAMTGKLTEMIRRVEGEGRMWSLDWDTEPIPQIGGEQASPSAREGAAGVGLRSKRSRWAEAEEAAEQQQQYQQQQQQQGGRKGAMQQHGKQGKQQQPLTKKQKKHQQEYQEEPVALSQAERSKIAARAGRFGDGRATGGVQSWSRNNNSRGRLQYNAYSYDEEDAYESEDELDFSTLTIRGTCTDLEKSYFRLTAAPDPSVVRSEPVLRHALDRLVGLLREGSVNYFYACDQFKGLRQDCTVQHLRNALVAEVYEAHARAALEYGDLAEFNQCQTQLASLYVDGVPGCVAEFTAYKVLYNTAHASAGANKALLATLQAALALMAGTTTGGVRIKDAEGAVANALRAQAAAASANYPAFFKAYGAAPALGRALLDVMAPRMRWHALNTLVKAYKASLPVRFVAQMLGFAPQPTGRVPPSPPAPLPGCRQAAFVGKAAAPATEEEGLQACVAWLQAHGAVVEETGV